MIIFDCCAASKSDSIKIEGIRLDGSPASNSCFKWLIANFVSTRVYCSIDDHKPIEAGIIRFILNDLRQTNTWNYGSKTTTTKNDDEFHLDLLIQL